MKIDKRKYIYLAGAIEHAKDGGRNWRRSIQTFLEDLGYPVLNPVDAEIKKLQAENTPDNWQKLKQTDITKYISIMRQIIDYDLDIVRNKSWLIVCKWDEHVQKGAGTISELSDAYMSKVPVHLITDTPLSEMPGWALACCDVFYTSLDDFKKRFKESLENEKM